MHLTLKGYVFAAAAAQWLAVLLIALFTPGRGGAWRKVESVLVVSTLLFGSAWYAIIVKKIAPKAQQAAMVQSHPGRSCEGIRPGTTEAMVKQKLGDPDHIRGEEDTRGPAAEVWVYDDVRCAVHLFGDRVDSVE